MSTKQQHAAEKGVSPEVLNGALKSAATDTTNPNDPNVGVSTVEVALENIRVKPNFNPRILEKPETEQKIKEITASYISGRHVPLIEVAPVANEPGVYEIVDGECRYTAAVDAGVEQLSVIVFKGDDKAKLIHTFLGNEGEPLTPFEQIRIIDRLKDEFKMKRDDIAKTLGKSIGWIDRLIRVSKFSDELTDLLRSGKVSMDVALQYDKEYGDHAALELAKIVGAVAEKVTSKTTRKAKESDEERAPTKAALLKECVVEFTQAVYDSGVPLPEKKNFKLADQVTVTLPGRAVKLMLDLMDFVTEQEPEPKEAKPAAGKQPAKKEPKKAPKRAPKK